MIISRLRVIRFASWFHLSYGVSILAFPLFGIDMPSPFGSMEAYLQYMPPWAMALMFVACGASSWAALRWRYHIPWLFVGSVIPQQLVLLWGVFWGVAAFLNTFYSGHEIDARGWLGIMQLSGLSFFHGRELIEIWTRAWGGGGDHECRT